MRGKTDGGRHELEVFSLTEKGYAALDDDNSQPFGRYGGKQGQVKSVRQQVLEDALAKLEETFPAWTIWFSKVSHVTTVWTATHPSAQGSVVEYSADALEQRLIPLNARLAS